MSPMEAQNLRIQRKTSFRAWQSRAMIAHFGSDIRGECAPCHRSTRPVLGRVLCFWSRWPRGTERMRHCWEIRIDLSERELPPESLKNLDSLCLGCLTRQTGGNCWQVGCCVAWRCQIYPSCDSCPLYMEHRRDTQAARSRLILSKLVVRRNPGEEERGDNAVQPVEER